MSKGKGKAQRETQGPARPASARSPAGGSSLVRGCIFHVGKLGRVVFLRALGRVSWHHDVELKMSRNGPCSTCGAPSLYRCPRCSTPSCSLACSIAHKAASSCTGIATPVWQQPLAANEWGWGPLMRDQSYISGVGRVVEEAGRKIAGEKLMPVGGTGGRPGGADDKSERLVGEARKEGVRLVRVPGAMSRRTKNSSRWDPKCVFFAAETVASRAELTHVANREKRMEWTLEVVFRRPSGKELAAPPATVVSPPAQPSSATMYSVLKATLDSKDRKGKGKEVSEDEKTSAIAERAWLDSHAPVEIPGAAIVEVPVAMQDPAPVESTEASTSALLPSPLPPTPAPEMPRNLSPEPFQLCLSPYTPPTASPTPTTKPDPRPLHALSLSSTLADVLSSTYVLEFPTLELWSNEALLRARAKGEVVLAPKVDLPPQEHGAREDSGRGRGRGGRGAGRGGRGGRGGGAAGEGRWDEARQEPTGEREQDSGWGKRAVRAVDGEAGDEDSREGKRVRVEENFADGAGEGEEADDAEDGEAYAGLVEQAMVEFGAAGGLGLANYGSDSE